MVTLLHMIAIAVNQAAFGRGTGFVLLSGVSCTGTESSLLSCGHYGIGVHYYCLHSDDVGVVCPTCKSCTSYLVHKIFTSELLLK